MTTRRLAAPRALIAAVLVAIVVAALPVQRARAQNRAAAAADSRHTPAQTAWPRPPDPPRVRYVTVYGGSQDVGAARKSRTVSLKEALLGRGRVAADRKKPDGFMKPFGVAVDGFGRIIVTDSAQASVVMMDPERRLFVPLGEGTGQALFRVPIGVAVDAANNIYVGDTGLNRVLVFGPNLAFKTTIGAAGELKAPSGLAVDEGRRRLYVVDSRQHLLVAFDLDTGKVQARVGSRGAAEGQFNFPTGVAVGPDGQVFVTDTMNYRVQVFGPDLRVVRSFGSLGVGPGQFRRPKGVAVDEDGVVYVVDSDFNNFQMFTPDGQALMWVGEMGQRPGQMLLPAGIAVDRRHRRILVSEQYNQRVQVFERVGPAERMNPPER